MKMARRLTVLGLVMAMTGIAVLWAAGVEFPFVIPPGIVVLGCGALVVALVRRPWAAALGAFLGLFVIVGFLISPTGIDNLTGRAGAAVATGQAIQLVGNMLALGSGIAASAQERRARIPSGRR